MDAFRWDDDAQKCVESYVGEMNPRLPMLHMEPKKNLVADPKHYISPLYRTAARAGTLSTTGTFFIFVLTHTNIIQKCYFILNLFSLNSLLKAIQRILWSLLIYQVITIKIIGLEKELL
jgi:hypothetical protein